MNKHNLEVSVYSYESVAEMWEDEIDVAFEELEQMIFKLDLSDETIQKLIDKLFDCKASLLYVMMFDVVEENTSNKETPKKVDTSVYGMFKCPTCANPFLDQREKYCCDCGQKLDWGKDDN
jgi:hypothetical protein